MMYLCNSVPRSDKVRISHPFEWGTTVVPPPRHLLPRCPQCKKNKVPLQV